MQSELVLRIELYLGWTEVHFIVDFESVEVNGGEKSEIIWLGFQNLVHDNLSSGWVALQSDVAESNVQISVFIGSEGDIIGSEIDGLFSDFTGSSEVVIDVSSTIFPGSSIGISIGVSLDGI